MCLCAICVIEEVVCNLCVWLRQDEGLCTLASLVDESMPDGSDRSSGPQCQGAQHWP